MSLNKKRWSKTSSFLLPACGLDSITLQEYGLINAYLNDYLYERDDSDHVEDIFTVFDPTLSDENFEAFCKLMRSHSNFLDEYDVSFEGSDLVVFRMKLNDQWKHIKSELITSKYSQIDRRYVQKYFKPRVFKGRDVYGQPKFEPSTNWQILTKAPELKDQLEESLNIDLPEEAEVWEKLHSEEEIFRFPNVEENKN